MNVRRIFWTVSVLFVLIGLYGCVGPSHIALKPGVQEEIKSVELCLGIAQQEIQAEIERSQVSAFTGGGLIPALIDVAIDQKRAKDAETLIRPLRTALTDYDFGESLTVQIREEIKSVDWTKVEEVRVLGDLSKGSYEKEFSNLKSSGILFITTRYFLSPDFKTLKVSANAKLFSQKAPKLDDGNALYKNELFFEEKLEKSASSKEEAAICWAEQEALLCRGALDAAIRDIARMIAIDLGSPPSPGGDKNVEETSIGDRKGALVLKAPERTIIRTSNGNLWSLRNP